MTRYEYLKLKLCNIPEKNLQLYNLREKEAQYSSVYVYIRKGVYILPQAGLISNELLKKILAKHEYTQSKILLGLWTHKWRPIQFILVVNNLGVKYVGK